MPEKTISQHDYELLLQRLHKLTEIGASLVISRDNIALLEQILLGAKDLTHADGGTLYLKDDQDLLQFEVLMNDSLQIHLGGTSSSPMTFEAVPLYIDGKRNETTVVSYCALHAKVVNIEDAYLAEGFDFSGTRKFDAQSNYHSKSFLTVPMKNHENDIIGVLQLINRRDENNHNIAFSKTDQQLVESLTATAAVSLTGKSLIDDLHHLFESFVKVIALAIDEKSPYTGGHCRRVPELTMMLAEACINTQQGPLKDFTMNDEDIYTLKTAAWLHDCGKIVTPEHIMDKSTKLSTIYDRIETINTRFDVAKRDLEITYLREQLAKQTNTTPDNIAQQTAEILTDDVRLLEKDRQFLCFSNIGGEFMNEKDQQRVANIGQRTIFLEGKNRSFLTDDEQRCLQIPRGTLLPEERLIINQHMDVTIQMLEALPFPKHMQQVPEYACGHHEHMDGSGYPRGLTREQLSIPARMMAIADVFEALIACDRPYKKGKLVSECLRIMAKMKHSQHLDPDLFDVFVREKVYLEYAKKFVASEQIDTIYEEDLI